MTDDTRRLAALRLSTPAPAWDGKTGLLNGRPGGTMDLNADGSFKPSDPIDRRVDNITNRGLADIAKQVEGYAPGPERAAAIGKIIEALEYKRLGPAQLDSLEKLEKVVSRCIETGSTDYDKLFHDLETIHASDTMWQDWSETVTPNPRLERCTGSKLHDLCEFSKAVFENGSRPELTPSGLAECRCFLVQHDWAAAFANSPDFEDAESEWRLPAERCAFEFRISGQHVIIVVADESICEHTACVVRGHRAHNVWMPLAIREDRGDRYRDDALHKISQSPLGAEWFDLAAKQIKAISIALEAEVAETTIERAPYKPNMARERKGLQPIFDYHVLSLARRSRPAPLPDDMTKGTHASPRLHFRRGHWRHYSDHKTWIKWQLVGDPDLGFIDKDYAV